MGWGMRARKQTWAISLAYKHFTREGEFIYLSLIVLEGGKSILLSSEGTSAAQTLFEEIASATKHQLNTNTLFSMYIRNEQWLEFHDNSITDVPLGSLSREQLNPSSNLLIQQKF